MDRSWRKITIRVGYELKTVQQLNALGIKYKIPISNVIVNGVKSTLLSKNGFAWAFIDDKEKQAILKLPYIENIE